MCVGREQAKAYCLALMQYLAWVRLLRRWGVWPSLANCCWLRMAFVMVPILPWVWRAVMRVLVLVAAYSLVREGKPSPPLSTSWNMAAVGKQSGRL